MAKASFKSLRRFARDVAGATAVEFAIVITPLLMILFGTFQMAIVFFYDQALQSATEASARTLMTGAAQDAGETQSQFQSAVCANAGSAFTCGNLMVDVQSAATFAQLNTTPIALTYSGSTVKNTFSYSPGGPSDVVIIRVMYNFPVWWPLLLPGYVNQPGNNILLTATSVLKNEPYQ
jgi:Flp pilus assembly protein TadG